MQREDEIRPGRYRHFKGNEYEVLMTARHSETLEPMVVYRALYGEGGVWVRPAAMWNEMVPRGGAEVRRFTPVDQTRGMGEKPPARRQDEDPGPHGQDQGRVRGRTARVNAALYLAAAALYFVLAALSVPLARKNATPLFYLAGILFFAAGCQNLRFCRKAWGRIQRDGKPGSARTKGGNDDAAGD